MKASLRIQISDSSQIGEARRNIAGLTAEQFPSEEAQGKIALITTELATNLLKHANGGEIYCTLYPNAVDILSVDQGPGMTDSLNSMLDGVSTAGTAGNGLGAVKRKADFFDLFTVPNQGTVILARVGKVDSKYDLGGICLPIPGENESGDNWSFKNDSTGIQVMVADGLGHGMLAAQASNAAVQAFDSASTSDHQALFQVIHGKLRVTRGAALSILKVNAQSDVALFAGIGNVAGALTQGDHLKRMISHPGIVGQNMRKVQDFSYPAPHGQSIFILYSDGISTRWELDAYPGVYGSHPSIISALIMRDHCRGKDDATVIAFRHGGVH